MEIKNIRVPIGLTIVIILSGIVIFEYFPLKYCTAIGTVVGGIGSIIAVIWFYTSLQFQRQQLEEQRQQFTSEFQQIREDSRRNALILSRDILNETEKRVLGQNSELKSVSDLIPLYFLFSEFKPIFEETDPHVVQQCIQNWMKKEGPAVILMKGIKSAAEIYFKVLDVKDVDFSKVPEEFVYIYGPLLWKTPFFDVYESVATMLANFMIMLSPGRESVMLASMVVMSMIAPKGVMKDDKILESIEKHRKKDYPLPKIVEKYLQQNNSKL